MTRLERLTGPRDRFGMLLVLLITSFVVTGLGGDPEVRGVAGILNLLVLLVGFTSTRLREKRTLAVVLAVIGTLGAFMVSTAPFNDAVSSIGASAQVLMLGVLTLAVLDRILRHETVSLQTLAGAVAAYFLLGQAFAWLYAALPGFFEGEVIAPAEEGEVPIYYSYVVLTTLGFGDIAPIGALAQRITVLEAISGQMFIAILVSILVSSFKRGTGLFDLPHADEDATT